MRLNEKTKRGNRIAPADKHPVEKERLKRQRFGKRTEYVTKNGEVKVLVSFLINKDLYEEFKGKAYELYGPGRGALSRCIESIIKSWIERDNSRAVNTRIEHVWRKVLEVAAKLQGSTIAELENAEVLEKHLEQAVAQVRGSDPRTIRKWISLFEKHGFIEYRAGFRPNRVFKIRIVPLTER